MSNCEYIAKELGAIAELNVMMKNYTTFRIGGPADIMISPTNDDELKKSIKLCKENELPYYIIGNGSNLLVRDKGIPGAVIRIAENYASIDIKENTVTAKAGILLSKLANQTLEHGLMGLEWACGIPGTLGGAVAMNAGAYGGEMKNYVLSVKVLKNGEIINHNITDSDMSYRYSLFSFPEFIVLESTLALSADDGHALDRKAEYNMARKTKQPLSLPSAGSTFKRPKGNFAGTLIDKAGLKGTSVGSAQVSQLHAGFIVNTGGATADDVIRLIDIVKEKVFAVSGVTLEPEIKIIGE